VRKPICQIGVLGKRGAIKKIHKVGGERKKSLFDKKKREGSTRMLRGKGKDEVFV